MQKATFSVIEAAEYIGIGRNKIYQLINEGIIPSSKNRSSIPLTYQIYWPMARNRSSKKYTQLKKHNISK